MAIAIDSSTPALATANTGNVATTASFVPPSGVVLAAFAWHDTAGGNTTNSSAVADSQTSAWTIRATRAKPDSGAQNGHVQVSTAVPAASTSMTAASTAINNGGSLAAGMYCAVLTGCDTTTPIDAIAEGSSASAVISQLITTVTDGALIMLINSDWNVAATPTAAAGLTVIVGTGLGTGPDMRIWLVRQTLLQTPAGSATIASTAPTSANTNNWIGVAFRPAAAGAANPIPAQPSRRRALAVARVLPGEVRAVQAPTTTQPQPVDITQARRRPPFRARRAEVFSPPWPVVVVVPPAWVPPPRRSRSKIALFRREGRSWQPPWVGAAPVEPPPRIPQLRRDRPLLPLARRGGRTFAPPFAAPAPPPTLKRRSVRPATGARRDRLISPPVDRVQLVPAPRHDRPLPTLRIRHPFRIVLPTAVPAVPPSIVLQPSKRRPRFLGVGRGRWFAPFLEGAEATECIVHRPYTGTAARGATGTVTRPYTGVVEHCSCCV